ncbi:sugar ABC transporter substrate-binding protein, partial [Candidatus Aerophobetes bacterium]|nr:sugar ABC transporter substrate-binding protein [Candidatus Aerophobetes bacterium]
MKKTFCLLAVGLMVGFLLSLTGGAFGAEKKFGLDDIPPIKNKTPITIALEAGGEEDTLLPIIKKFEEKTGVKVNTEVMLFAVMYGKENIELVGGTGAYDIP